MDDDLRALRDSCTRALTGHGIQRADDLLATIPPGTAVDRYGEGGVVAELEAEVRVFVEARRVVAQRPRHPEVNQESTTRLEPNNQILAATLHRSDALADELRRNLVRVVVGARAAGR